MRSEGVNRLVVLVAGAALVGGLAGAGLELALAGSGSGPGDTLPPEERVAGAVGSVLGPQGVYRQAAAGVVVVRTVRGRVLGSGFVFDRNGDVVTTGRVVAGRSRLVVGFSPRTSYPASVRGRDPATDLAVLRVQAPSDVLHPLTLHDSDAVQVGDAVYAIGKPHGAECTMTAGIVSGAGSADTVQTDARMVGGSIGGPLLDAHGGVVGVDDRRADGMSLAIAANTARTVVSQLIARGRASRAWLGVEGAPSDGGVLVLRLAGRGPAARAGLEAGDRIVAAGGARIASTTQLANVVRLREPGDRVALEVERGGRRRTVTVTLGAAPR